MPKFPNPPPASQLSALVPEIRLLGPDALIWRVYSQGGHFPTTWNEFRAYGPTDSRFDHHIPPAAVQARKIMYGARHGPTCIAEVFQPGRTIDRTSRSPWLAGFRLTKALSLLNLTGAWPTRAGASMAINTGLRSRARLWSQAIYETYPTIDGLFYCSSMDANRSAVALYERAESALPSTPTFHRALSDPAMETTLKRAAHRFGYALL